MVYEKEFIETNEMYTFVGKLCLEYGETPIKAKLIYDSFIKISKVEKKQEVVLKGKVLHTLDNKKVDILKIEKLDEEKIKEIINKQKESGNIFKNRFNIDFESIFNISKSREDFIEKCLLINKDIDLKYLIRKYYIYSPPKYKGRRDRENIKPEINNELITERNNINYKKIYEITKDRNDFVSLAESLNKGIKRHSIIRRFYDVSKTENLPKKESNEIIEKQYPDNEKEKPNIFKMNNLKDLIKYKKDLKLSDLNKQGFNMKEINWVEDEGLIPKNR